MAIERPTVGEVRALLSGAAPERLPALISGLIDDDRAGVVTAVEVARRRAHAHHDELARLERMARAQVAIHAAGYAVVAGVDEVGRGCLAGPVTAAAVVLTPDTRIPRVADSKTLTPAAREEIDVEIRSVAVAFSIAHVEPAEIDRIGIGRATEAAMRQALAALDPAPDHAIVDGRLTADIGVPYTAVIKGDGSVACIAAASIVAKVARDALMVELDAECPGYGLAANKGYGSPDHLAALEDRGPSFIHRRSFGPCSQGRLF